MKTIINTASTYIEHDGTRYMLEYPAWRKMRIWEQSQQEHLIKEAIKNNPSTVEIVTSLFKLIRLGPI